MTSPNNQVLLNNLTFIQNLARVTTQAVTSKWTNGQAVLESIFGSTQVAADAAINLYLATFNISGTPLPSNFDDFINGFVTFAHTHGSPGATLPTSPTVLQRFTTDYQNFLNSTGGDWSQIVPGSGTASISTQFKNWFSTFLANYPYVSGSGVVGTMTAFFANAATDLTTTAAVKTGSSLFDSLGAPISEVQNPFPRYQALYDLLFPDGDFSDRISAFYDEQVANNGYFNPSQDYDKWAREITREYAASIGVSTIFGPTTLDSADFDKTLILNDIYSLVSSMMTTLQRVTAAQANRLFTLTQWQNAYTDAISQLHVFLQSDGSPLSATGIFGDNDAKAAVRSQLNDYLNSNFRQNMQSYQSAVGDDAKALQSNLNQSNDAVSQQSNMATAIIQTLSTILSAIIPPP